MVKCAKCQQEEATHDVDVPAGFAKTDAFVTHVCEWCVNDVVEMINAWKENQPDDIQIAKRNEEDLKRAIKQGIVVERLKDGMWIASSGTDDTKVYYITKEGRCNCQGFTSHGHCKHSARVKWAMAGGK
jgi:hypothetical protein